MNKTSKLSPYTLQQVSLHNKKEDAWIIINGWVLDITYFFQLHPGGDQILHQYLGKDASSVFKDDKVHRHSIAAYNLLKKFRVGYVQGMVKESDVKDALNETKYPEDYGIDLNRGLVWQTALLGEKYDEFIKKTFLAPEQKTLKYFDNVVLEFFSKSPWYTVPILWIPLLLLQLVFSVKLGVGLIGLPVLFVVGVLSWCLLEYTLHRFIFHMETSTFSMNILHFCLHGYHHIAPMDPFRLTFPPVPAILIGVILYSTFTPIFGLPTTMALLTGITFGYICYDLEHYALHHSAFLNSVGYYKNMKKHHLYHHYKNENSNFGISSMLFDYVFQSFDKSHLKTA
jgi:4-hydroxysphinganine ceramide fatty acyl 2-hydroxylase